MHRYEYSFPILSSYHFFLHAQLSDCTIYNRCNKKHIINKQLRGLGVEYYKDILIVLKKKKL